MVYYIIILKAQANNISLGQIHIFRILFFPIYLPKGVTDGETLVFFYNIDYYYYFLLLIICLSIVRCMCPTGGHSPGEEVRCAASKQMVIVCPPAVLTLQLKRFHNSGVHLAKSNRHVHFPLVLDLAPFTSTIALVCSVSVWMFAEIFLKGSGWIISVGS